MVYESYFIYVSTVDYFRQGKFDENENCFLIKFMNNANNISSLTLHI